MFIGNLVASVNCVFVGVDICWLSLTKCYVI